MKKEHIKYLACPNCINELEIVEPDNLSEDEIEQGLLQCIHCRITFPIVGHIPRFVPLENYSSSFGFEWNRHARTQYDSYMGTNVSASRFFEETKWPRHMEGETILEVGSGSGRFTEVAAATGAMVVSMDYSYAVEANYNSNGHKNNVLIVQGNIYQMPFKRKAYDRVFCIGVLQHTPDVEKAFLSLPPFLKIGGKLTVDVYRYNWWRYFLVTRYWIRPLTRRLAPATLYRYCEAYVNLMWPLARWINKLPKGRLINRGLLIADYRGKYPLSEKSLKEWAILDTFDGLSPAYDNPQTIRTLKSWFDKAGLKEVGVHYGYNGIEGRGTMPA